MKKLTKHGNSLALVIEKPILDLLKIDANTQLEVSTDGDVLVVRPHRLRKDTKRIKEALEWVNANYGSALKRLAE
ncbi:MAG: AbrB/MazE/SpoVT family DNA-binding domain-containing protein [FCB group bacterium]|jgi:antitoxin component of MazEF toxin-antitoxin module|nr:AbrB/MazE/SpoVT family DNA-binding domain-containing protein [FCB group bacterium]